VQQDLEEGHGVDAAKKVCGTGHVSDVLTDGRRLDQLKSNLLGSPLKDCPSTLMSFCNVSNYTG